MASNGLPKNLDQLLTMAAGMANGTKAQEAQVGLKQNTDAGLRADLTAATAARSDYRKAVADNTALNSTLATVDSDVRAFIGTAKGVLGTFLGRQWSTAWLPAGFANSLATPSTLAQRHDLLESLVGYLQANTDKQVVPLNFTSARADELLAALNDARTAVNGSTIGVTLAKTARDNTEQALRNRMSGLIAELRQLLDDDDPVWYAFGLNRPSDPETPGVPDNLMLTGGLPGSIHVTWAPSRRAVRYRVYKKEEGDADFQAAFTVPVPEVTLIGLKSGSTVEVQVSAANNAGESKPSEPVHLQVPAAPA